MPLALLTALVCSSKTHSASYTIPHASRSLRRGALLLDLSCCGAPSVPRPLSNERRPPERASTAWCGRESVSRRRGTPPRVTGPPPFLCCHRRALTLRRSRAAAPAAPRGGAREWRATPSSRRSRSSAATTAHCTSRSVAAAARARGAVALAPSNAHLVHPPRQVFGREEAAKLSLAVYTCLDQVEDKGAARAARGSGARAWRCLCPLPVRTRRASHPHARATHTPPHSHTPHERQ